MWTETHLSEWSPSAHLRTPNPRHHISPHVTTSQADPRHITGGGQLPKSLIKVTHVIDLDTHTHTASDAGGGGGGQ